jgi:hypothetical protein
MTAINAEVNKIGTYLFLITVNIAIEQSELHIRIFKYIQSNTLHNISLEAKFGH